MSTMSDTWRRQVADLASEGEWQGLARLLGVSVGTLASPSALASHLDEIGVDFEPSWWERVQARWTFEERWEEGHLMHRQHVEPEGIDWHGVSDRVRTQAQGMIDDGEVLDACRLLGLPPSSAANPDRLATALSGLGIEMDEPEPLWARIKEAATKTEWASEWERETREPLIEAVREVQAEREERPLWPAPKGMGLVMDRSGTLVHNLPEVSVEQIRETSPEVLERWGTAGPMEHRDAEAEVRARVAGSWRDLRYGDVEEIATEVLGRGQRADALAAAVFEERVEAMAEREADR